MATAYYNEIDGFAAAWLRELMAAGLIMDGVVDERDIREVEPSDLRGFTRCHFFAGIGGWDYALQLAGWPDDRPVWTGSCPCTKVSGAQMYEPLRDPSECWPNFLRLIRSGKPAVVFGEQSASKDGVAWLDGVWGDLEESGYAFWPSVLCAAGVGAPHVRQRVFWLGHADCSGLEGHARHEGVQQEPGRHDTQAGRSGPKAGVHDHWDSWRLVERTEPTKAGGKVVKRSRVQPGAFPLAHGIPARVGRLRGYGNAIVPQVGAKFVGAYLDTVSESGVA